MVTWMANGDLARQSRRFGRPGRPLAGAKANMPLEHRLPPMVIGSLRMVKYRTPALLDVKETARVAFVSPAVLYGCADRVHDPPHGSAHVPVVVILAANCSNHGLMLLPNAVVPSRTTIAIVAIMSPYSTTF